MIPYRSRLRSSARDISKSLRDIHMDHRHQQQQQQHNFQNERAILKPNTQRLCGSCHFSCLKCRGPSDSECTACAPDAQLNSRSATEAFCIGRIAINGTHDAFLKSTQDKHALMFMFAAIITSIGLITAIVWSVLRLVRRSKEHNYTYDRIAFTGTDERAMIGQDILCESSDSDID